MRIQADSPSGIFLWFTALTSPGIPGRVCSETNVCSWFLGVNYKVNPSPVPPCGTSCLTPRLLNQLTQTQFLCLFPKDDTVPFIQDLSSSDTWYPLHTYNVHENETLTLIAPSYEFLQPAGFVLVSSSSSSILFCFCFETESSCVAQARHQSRNPPASASRVLGLQGCATTPSFCFLGFW